MKIPRTVKAVGHIDDDLITAAAENRKNTKQKHWLLWGSIAACFVMFVLAGALILPPLLNSNTPADNTTSRYKDFNLTAGEYAIVWPWEYKTVYEKYTVLSLDGIDYWNRGIDISDELVGELIGTQTVTGQDEITGTDYSAEFEVYELKYAVKSQYVAVKMDDIFYVFMNDTYAPPSTLGELFDLINFSEAVNLNRFTVNDETTDKKYFSLNDDDFIWNTLADCKAAAFVEDEHWIADGRESISFTITSQTLGVYKTSMYITSDGYLWTNAFLYQYLFNIGTDAAGRIIEYAKSNSTETSYEPYENSIIGTITEITDDYILVDDSILCKNPDLGITYKILLNDIRLSRCIDYRVVSKNDTIQITYKGEINKQDSNTIDSAVSITEVIIYDGDVLIPE